MPVLKDPGVSQLSLTGIIAGSLRGLVMAGARETSSGLLWGADLWSVRRMGQRSLERALSPFQGWGVAHPEGGGR